MRMMTKKELKMISDKVDKELDIIGVSPHLQGRKIFT